MGPKKHKITVEIYGESYPLKGDAEPERIRQIAALLDERMKEAARANPRLSGAKIAILAALNIAEDYLRLESDYQHLRKMLTGGK